MMQMGAGPVLSTFDFRPGHRLHHGNVKLSNGADVLIYIYIYDIVLYNLVDSCSSDKPWRICVYCVTTYVLF